MRIAHNSSGAKTFVPVENVDKIIELPGKGTLILHKTGEKTFSPQKFNYVLCAYENAKEEAQ